MHAHIHLLIQSKVQGTGCWEAHSRYSSVLAMDSVLVMNCARTHTYYNTVRCTYIERYPKSGLNYYRSTCHQTHTHTHTHTHMHMHALHTNTHTHARTHTHEWTHTHLNCCTMEMNCDTVVVNVRSHKGFCFVQIRFSWQ